MQLREKVIVANTGDDTLTFIDFKDGNKIDTLDLKDSINSSNRQTIRFHGFPIGPYDLEYNRKDCLYCTNVYDNSVLKIDLKHKKIVDIISVGKYPTCIKYFQNKLYITNSDSNSISIVDADEFSLIENIPVGEKPIDIEIDENNFKMYVANSNGYSIDMIDLKGKTIETIKLDNNPVKMVIDRDQMFILSNINNSIINNSNISIMDIKTHKKKDSRVFKGIFNNMFKINSSEIIFITSMDNGYLYRMDLEKKDLLSKTYLAGMPNKLGWNGDNILFISNLSTNKLILFDINTNKIIENIEVGKEPSGILTLN